MWTYKTIEIAEDERALLFVRGAFAGVLRPGVHRRFLPRRHEVARYSLTHPRFEHRLADVLIKGHRELVEEHLHVFDLSDEQVGIVYLDGKLHALIGAGSRAIYWRGLHEIRVEIQDISEELEVPAALTSLLGHGRALASDRPIHEAVLYSEVADGKWGLLYVNKKLERVLEPGAYAFWRYNRGVDVRQIDRDLQTLEVSGQEILTKDKVALRMNLAALFRVRDPRRAVTELPDFRAYLYREAQLGLRQAVGGGTLDELLTKKEALNTEVAAYLRGTAEPYGIEIGTVGVKDIILPGEMKAILAKVVEAERTAEANLILRREETAATRSLANTARMMESNPTLLRLKELEALERITERIDRLTVFGGLGGVLKDLVQLRD